MKVSKVIFNDFIIDKALSVELDKHSDGSYDLNLVQGKDRIKFKANGHGELLRKLGGLKVDFDAIKKQVEQSPDLFKKIFELVSKELPLADQMTKILSAAISGDFVIRHETPEANPAVALGIFVKIGGKKRKVDNMNHKLSDGALEAFFEAVDEAGAPAAVDGVPVWASSDESVVTIAPSADGMTAVLTPLKVGAALIQVTVDADMTEGTRTIIGEGELRILGNEAVKVTLGFKKITTPEPTPTP